MKAWRVRDIATSQARTIELQDKRGRVIATVDGKQMLLLFAAMTAIQDVAEINAELFVLAGKEPNAFATVGEDEEKNEQNVVGFTMGMLDLIGNDVDGMAAIIGHELAHLKLKHIEEKRIG